MQIKDIMTKGLEVISSDSNLTEIAKKMRSFGCGAMPVFESNKIIGIVTDRDIVVRAIADGKDPSQTSAKDIMSVQPCCCFEDDSIEEAVKMMENKKVKRILVKNPDGNPIGIISLGDIAAKSHLLELSGQAMEVIAAAKSNN
jgi:CBS domain-containing protein